MDKYSIFSNLIKLLFIVILGNTLFSVCFTDFFKISEESSKHENGFNLNNGPKATTSYYSWESKWYDYDYNYYSGTTRVRNTDVFGSMLYKKMAPASNWSEYYRSLYLYDKSKLDLVYPMLDRIWNNNNFTRRGFVDVVVSFVQNIQYNIIIMEDCKSAYTNDKSVYEMMNAGYECDGEVYAGLYTPLEFMAKYKGDCDTRTVFLYTILKRYNYDVVILNSEVYAHSIIGVNISSSGRYKSYLGKRYYTWEVTNKGWRLGMLPPQNSNINYWKVIL